MRVRLTEKFPRRQALICLATLAVVAMFSTEAPGCTCVYLPKHATAFRKASAVFVGEVVGKMQTKLPKNWDSEKAPPVIDVVTFKVERRWKGARGSEVEAWIDVRFSHCSSLTFRQGQKYLIYADSYKGSLVIYWCEKSAWTSPLSSADVPKLMKELDSFRARR